MDQGKNEMGFAICCMAKRLKRNVDRLPSFVEMEELTGSNGFIIEFLARRQKNGVATYQKDLERHFSITRSTASKVVTLMEQKGLVERVGSDKDGRMKQLRMTEKSLAMSSKIDEELHAFEKAISEGISAEDMEAVSRTFATIFRNLEKIEKESGSEK